MSPRGHPGKEWLKERERDWTGGEQVKERRQACAIDAREEL